jgi:hypothetical protein
LPEDVQGFLAAGDPPIVFTPGSAMQHGQLFFTESVAACQLSSRRGLLLTRFREQVPDRLPEGVCHFDYLPFSQVLPHSAALVSHGGIGTVAQGLAAASHSWSCLWPSISSPMLPVWNDSGWLDRFRGRLTEVPLWHKR